MKITTFTGIKILTSTIAHNLMEQIPAKGADIATVRLFEIKIREFISGVRDEDGTQAASDILTIPARAEVVAGR